MRVEARATMSVERPTDVSWELTTLVEEVAGDTYALEALSSFERNSALLYQAWRGKASARARDDWSPMFGVIWGACRALNARLAELDLRGKLVLELGCGLALPSMVAARQGATVIATDQHPETARFLARNLARNGIEGVTYQHLDWREPQGLPVRSFDLVLASDVLFAHDLPPLVLAMFDRYLADDGLGWLADPGRAWLPEVETAAQAMGLSLDIDVVQDAFLLELRH